MPSLSPRLSAGHSQLLVLSCLPWHGHSLLACCCLALTGRRALQEWTGAEEVGAAMLSVLRRLPRTQWLLTTLGTRGSILLERQTDEDEGAGTGSHFGAIMHGLEAANQLRDSPQAPMEGCERFQVGSGSGWASSCAAPLLQLPASSAAPAGHAPPTPRCTGSISEIDASCPTLPGVLGQLVA